jgi:hypothetical protein
MKPPRVVSHMGYFYVVYYLPGERHAIKEPVGIKLDIEAGTGDWWKKSKHRAKIKIVLEDALTRKLRYKQGHEFERHRSRVLLRSLEDLLTEYNEEQVLSKGGEASPDTLAKRRNAVKALQRFVPKASIRLSRKMAAALRDDALGELEAETVRSYVTFLRSLFTFAVDKGYIAANPFHKISVSVSEKEVRHIDRTDQVRVFDELFNSRRDVFWQVMFIRLSGYRVSEAGSLETVSTYSPGPSRSISFSSIRAGSIRSCFAFAGVTASHWPSGGSVRSSEYQDGVRTN